VRENKAGVKRGKQVSRENYSPRHINGTLMTAGNQKTHDPMETMGIPKDRGPLTSAERNRISVATPGKWWSWGT